MALDAETTGTLVIGTAGDLKTASGYKATFSAPRGNLSIGVAGGSDARFTNHGDFLHNNGTVVFGTESHCINFATTYFYNITKS